MSHGVQTEDHHTTRADDKLLLERQHCKNVIPS